jgi:hypothetical protein
MTPRALTAIPDGEELQQWLIANAIGGGSRRAADRREWGQR